MYSEIKIKEVEYRQLLEELNQQKSISEQAKQDARNIRHRLDQQIDIFRRIHDYSQQAFHAKSSQDFFDIIADGAVDVFQLEVGVVLIIDNTYETLQVTSACNLDISETNIVVPQNWLSKTSITVEFPVKTSQLASFGLECAIYCPMYDDDHKILGFILAGITASNLELYEFIPEEISSSFLLYCQQMTSILNNIATIERAKKAGEAQNRFFANLSHEIRTPLNAIIGMAQIGLLDKDKTDLVKCLSQINISSKHLLELVNEVLDLSKLEEERFELSREPFVLDTLIDNVMSNIKAYSEKSTTRLQVHSHDIKGMHVIGDSMRLTQVLLNIMSNAVKFNCENGIVSLNVQEVSRTQESILVKFTVSDQGIGIAKEDRERIFSVFEQGNKNTYHTYGGTGLGLPISQRIVELMGGEIKVNSEEGLGSKFSFSIWLDINRTEIESDRLENISYDFSGKKFLIVDDIDINRDIIITFLEGTGVTCLEASTGLEAFEAFQSSELFYYDLILMDIQMPEMDGYEATHCIRESKRSDSLAIPILAVTANAFREDMEKAVAAGMNGHISKPIHYHTAMNTICGVLEKA